MLLARPDLILSVLRLAATRRDAKGYVNKYRGGSLLNDGQKKTSVVDRLLNRPIETAWSGKAFSNFDNGVSQEGFLTLDQDTLRTAIVKIRKPQSFSSSNLSGIGVTISRLLKLGIRPIVVVDPDISDSFSITHKGAIQSIGLDVVRAIQQGSKMLNSRGNAIEARLIDSLVNVGADSSLHIIFPQLLTAPLLHDVVPVILNIGYSLPDARERLVSSDSIVELLATVLSPRPPAEIVCVDRVIYIDPLGGIPSSERGTGAAHVFINLKQEYDLIINELSVNVVNKQHISNLKALNRVLNILPWGSSGLITTPRAAAIGSQDDGAKNPILFNLVTDKPLFSSSLPLGTSKTPKVPTTIIRKGMPLRMIQAPSPTPNSTGGFSLDNNPEIDLDKLVYLINDSFGRKLDVDRYLLRTKNQLAGVLIAGDYEGAAIITYERANNNNRQIPYLDKFAVLSKVQGGMGVADVLFKAMTIKMFPNELIWRSRKTNPVNKWYFDRSDGSFKLPNNSPWSTFWTGEKTRDQNLLNEKDKLVTLLTEYQSICSSIVPTWLT